MLDCVSLHYVYEYPTYELELLTLLGRTPLDLWICVKVCKKINPNNDPNIRKIGEGSGTLIR